MRALRYFSDDLEGVPDVDEQQRSNAAIKIRIYNKKAFEPNPGTSEISA